MKIKHLREWLQNLPTDYDETDIVFRKIEENKEQLDYWIAIDIPISGCGIDDGNNEMYFCDENSIKILQ